MLEAIIKALANLLLKLTLALKKEYPTTSPNSPERKRIVAAWANETKKVMARYIQAAYFLGYDEPAIDATELADAVAPTVETQFDYLKGFATEIEENEGDWKAGWESRAESYAGAMTQPYWQGKTKMLPLPAVPGQGTQCLGRCRCSWDIKKLTGEGNYDCYWKAKDESGTICQTCKQRAEEWNPLKIRDGRLVIE